MSDFNVSLDLTTDMIIVQDVVAGWLGVESTLTVDEFRKYFERGGEYAKANRTQMVQRLIEMDFNLTELKEFYSND